MDQVSPEILYSAAAGVVTFVIGSLTYGYRKITQLESKKVDYTTLRQILDRFNLQQDEIRRELTERLDRIYELLITERK